MNIYNHPHLNVVGHPAMLQALTGKTDPAEKRKLNSIKKPAFTPALKVLKYFLL